ncbi:hypothetical protein EDD15DRAFT_1757992 [Pisolithus albus]|nr:hypothetical protein EDD15DRAFT_1757992 [Pisolithus albus]
MKECKPHYDSASLAIHWYRSYISPDPPYGRPILSPDLLGTHRRRSRKLNPYRITDPGDSCVFLLLQKNEQRRHYTVIIATTAAVDAPVIFLPWSLSRAALSLVKPRFGIPVNRRSMIEIKVGTAVDFRMELMITPRDKVEVNSAFILFSITSLRRTT